MYMMENGSKVTMDMVFKPFTREAWASMVLFFVTLALGYHVFSRSRDSIQYTLRCHDNCQKNYENFHKCYCDI